MNAPKKLSKDIVEEKYLHESNQGEVTTQKNKRLAIALRENLKKRKHQKKLRMVFLKDLDNNNLVED